MCTVSLVTHPCATLAMKDLILFIVVKAIRTSDSNHVLLPSVKGPLT